MPRMRKAVFPGSFDPLTLGHTDIVRRALTLFDQVVVAVLENSAKQSLFSAAARCKMIEEEFADCQGKVVVSRFSGLLVDFIAQAETNAVVRGLRAVSDYDYETQMALMNRRLRPGLETVFLVTREEYSFISSSMVKQVASMGGDVSSFVPAHVAKALRRVIGRRGKRGRR